MPYDNIKSHKKTGFHPLSKRYIFRKTTEGGPFRVKWVKKLSKFNERSSAEDFIKHYDENSNKRYILEEDVEYPKNLFNLHKDLPFLAERKKIEKCNYVVHIRALKQALSHGLILKKVLRVIQFNQKAWLKPYIDMNTKVRTEEKMILRKISSN